MSFNPSVLGGTQAYHQAIVEQLLFDVKGYTQIQRVRQDLISLLQQYSSLSARSAPFGKFLLLTELNIVFLRKIAKLKE
jgi:hypothetical protein